MEKKKTNNTKMPQGYYDDRGIHIIQPGDSIILYFADPQVQIIAVRLEDLSNPPSGSHKVTNLYVDPKPRAKTVVTFKNEPEE